MNTYSIIEKEHCISLVEEDIFGNPVKDQKGQVVFTPCENLEELIRELSKALDIEIYYCRDMQEWTLHVERMKQEFT